MAKKVIGIGYTGIHLIYLLIIPLMRQVRSYTLKGFGIKDLRSVYPFITTGLMFFGMMLSGCLELVSIYHQRPIKVQDKVQRAVDGNLVDFRKTCAHLRLNKRRTKKRMYLLICLASTLDYISSLAVFILMFTVPEKEFKFELKPYQLLFTGLLCWYCLSYHLYRHHYVSMGIIFLSTILITYRFYPEMDWNIAVIVASFLLKGVKNVVEKYLIEIKYFSIYKILFFEGMFGCVFSVLAIALFSNVRCPKALSYCSRRRHFENLIEFVRSPTVELLFTCIFDVLYFACLNVFYFLINKYYSPTHMVVSDVIVSVFDWIADLVTGVMIRKIDIALESVGYLVLVTSCLIYNEIIIIYVCKMGYYTREEIKNRGELDFKENVNIPLFEIPDSQENNQDGEAVEKMHKRQKRLLKNKVAEGDGVNGLIED